MPPDTEEIQDLQLPQAPRDGSQSCIKLLPEQTFHPDRDNDKDDRPKSPSELPQAPRDAAYSNAMIVPPRDDAHNSIKLLPEQKFHPDRDDDKDDRRKAPYNRSPVRLPAKRNASDIEEHVVWPPVVVIVNTLTGRDPQSKLWKGLENEEIRSFLKGVKDLEYGRVMALYGPRGNRGLSLVIFPPTHLGFMDAQALCECLERDKRGRGHWLKVASAWGCNPYAMCGLDREGLVTSDGKKIIYGYLATERDMMDADPKRKIVKRWSVESYADKVLAPIKKIEMENEEARRKREKLAEEAKHKLLAVEHNKSEFGKVAAEFRKISEEIQQRKREEEEVEATHRRNFEQRKKQYEVEKVRKVNEFQSRENDIRARLQQNKIAKETDIVQYKEVAQVLKDGIDEEKKKHELRLAEQKQIEMMELMKLDSILQAMMEEKLASLETSFHEKQLKLQEQHNKQIMKCREDIAAERESLLTSKLKELHEIEEEVKSAKETTEQKQQEAQNECIVCFEVIGVDKMERAHFQACGHANICSSCADSLWKNSKEKKQPFLCPTCKVAQKKKFTLLPAKIFS